MKQIVNKPKENFKDNKRDFRTLNDELGDSNKTLPIIQHNGVTLRSQRKISDTFNKYFKKNIEDIREKFDDENEKAIKILNALDPKKNLNLILKLNVYDVNFLKNEVISKCKHWE